MTSRTKCSCIYCRAQISVSNLKNHCFSKSCNSGTTHKPKQFIPNSLECPFCNKVHKTHNSMCQHAVRCKRNPNRKINPHSFGGNKYHKPAWNKGLTKQTDARVARSGKTLSENMASGKTNKPVNPPKSEATLAKLSILAIERSLGGVRQSRRIEYNGVKLGSSYEVTLAKSLDENSIKWVVPERVFYNDLNGKRRSYTADFYLPDFNVYLDPKNDFLLNNVNPTLGFCDCDKIKWVCKQNNIKVIVLDKTQLTWSCVLELLQ